MKVAHANTADSRKYNRQRLELRANAGEIHVGDSVILKADDRSALASRWDPQWEVTRVSGPVVYVRHQQTGRLRTVNREKARIVDPSITLDECRPRPPRATQRRRVFHYRRRPEATVEEDVIIQQPMGEVHDPPITADNADTLDQPTMLNHDNEPDQSVDAHDPATPPIEMTDFSNEYNRPLRRSRLTERARLAADDFDSDNLVGRYYRKRQRSAIPNQDIQKRARCEAIVLVSTFCC